MSILLWFKIRAFQIAIVGGLIAVGLAACDHLSIFASDRSVAKHEFYMTKAMGLCRKSNSVRMRNGDKRSCRELGGLDTRISSTKPDFNATIDGVCKNEKSPSNFRCSVNAGAATISGIYKGHNFDMSKLCAAVIKKGRYSENLKFREVVFLDYGIKSENRDQNDRYVLAGVAQWAIFDPKRSKMKRPVPLLAFIGVKRERFRCVVENGKVMALSYRELGSLTRHESLELNRREFFSN